MSSDQGHSQAVRWHAASHSQVSHSLVEHKNQTGFGAYHEWTQLGVPHVGEIDMDMIMFVFDKLTSGRKQIPRQIQNELKQHYAEQLHTFAATRKSQSQVADSAVDDMDDEDLGADLAV